MNIFKKSECEGKAEARAKTKKADQKGSDARRKVQNERRRTVNGWAFFICRRRLRDKVEDSIDIPFHP